jgi:hypothetical protein
MTTLLLAVRDAVQDALDRLVDLITSALGGRGTPQPVPVPVRVKPPRRR